MAIRRWREDTAPLPKIPSGAIARRQLKNPIRLAIITVAILGLVTVGITFGEVRRVQLPKAPNIVSATPTPTPTPVITTPPSSSPEIPDGAATKPTTPILVNSAPNGHGACLVLDKAGCQSARLVYFKGDLVGVGYDVPTGTTVFAPEDGVVVPLSVTQKNSNTVLYTYAVLYVTENGDVKNASYLISVLSNLKVTSPIGKEIHRGDAIGRVISAIPGADAPLVVRVVGSGNAQTPQLYTTYLKEG